MQKFESNVGVEVEFFVQDAKGNLVLPPYSVDTDDFPLLGEIRSEPCGNIPDLYASFMQKRMVAEKDLPQGKTMDIVASRRVPLKLYKSAMARCTTPKNESNSDVLNIYGTDITDCSDQIIKAGKIQGINASCGIHLHFSCRKIDEVDVEEAQYSPVMLPIHLANMPDNGIDQLFKPSLDLYSFDDYKKTKTLTASASMLNKPTVEWIVRNLDERYFAKYTEGHLLTKYRQPGFYELKPYGFEYRSLPATEEVLKDLPEILAFCFELLAEAKQYT